MADTKGRIILITGVMAAGKTTVAQAVAERLDRSIHLRGDVFRRMIVNGRVDMSNTPDTDALQQLMLRYQAAAATAKLYCHAGFSVVYQDVIIGPLLQDVIELFPGESLSVFVLCPSADTVAQREQTRGEKRLWPGYRRGVTGHSGDHPRCWSLDRQFFSKRCRDNRSHLSDTLTQG